MEEVFKEIHKYDMCLNPEKFTFRVGGRKYLGFMITHQGIEANPNKCTAILEMQSPNNIREVQKLNGRWAFLSRFLSKLVEKTKPFYKLLRKTESFLWNEACKQAFLALKKTIATPPVLSWPKPGASLFLYLSVAEKAISSTLVQEDGKYQTPIYFVSHILHDVGKRYQMIEKVALALITSAQRLKPYFQSP